MRNEYRLLEKLLDPRVVERHGLGPAQLLVAARLLVLPAIVAATAPETGFYGMADWVESGFAWFAFAFLGNWFLGSGFSLGILFLATFHL